MSTNLVTLQIGYWIVECLAFTKGTFKGSGIEKDNNAAHVYHLPSYSRTEECRYVANGTSKQRRGSVTSGAMNANIGCGIDVHINVPFLSVNICICKQGLAWKIICMNMWDNRNWFQYNNDNWYKRDGNSSLNCCFDVRMLQRLIVRWEGTKRGWMSYDVQRYLRSKNITLNVWRTHYRQLSWSMMSISAARRGCI